jgi:hypothetical protein
VATIALDSWVMSTRRCATRRAGNRTPDLGFECARGDPSDDTMKRGARPGVWSSRASVPPEAHPHGVRCNRPRHSGRSRRGPSGTTASGRDDALSVMPVTARQPGPAQVCHSSSQAGSVVVRRDDVRQAKYVSSIAGGPLEENVAKFPEDLAAYLQTTWDSSTTRG